MKTLVTGGIRSGKSAFAETLLAHAGSVTYVATGPQHDDPDWQARIAAHQARRPASWQTVETRDVAALVSQSEDAVLVDCLGTWLTGQLDDLCAWEEPPPDWEPTLEGRIAELAAAVAEASCQIVLVTNEVGMGLVAPHRSGRIFADWLGRLNQRMAQQCDHVVLVVSGIPVPIKGHPR